MSTVLDNVQENLALLCESMSTGVGITVSGYHLPDFSPFEEIQPMPLMKTGVVLAVDAQKPEYGAYKITFRNVVIHAWLCFPGVVIGPQDEDITIKIANDEGEFDPEDIW